MHLLSCLRGSDGKNYGADSLEFALRRWVYLKAEPWEVPISRYMVGTAAHSSWRRPNAFKTKLESLQMCVGDKKEALKI